MKTFNHSHIVNKYSKEFTFTRNNKGEIVDGVPKINKETFIGKAAVLQLNPLQLQDMSDYIISDKAAYFSKKQGYIPKIGDTFVLNGNKYILHKPLDNEYLSDYIRFIARRDVVGDSD